MGWGTNHLPCTESVACSMGGLGDFFKVINALPDDTAEQGHCCHDDRNGISGRFQMGR